MFHQVNAHIARFAKHTCKIEVTVGASASGPPPIFVAEAFVREQVSREFRPVVWGQGVAVAIHSDTEGQPWTLTRPRCYAATASRLVLFSPILSANRRQPAGLKPSANLPG